MSTFTAYAFAMWPTVTNNDNIAFNLSVPVCSRFQQHREAQLNFMGETPPTCNNFTALAEVTERWRNILGFL